MIISWLFIPGSEDKFLNKVKDLKADALIYDLEDSVANPNKESARLKVYQTIKSVKGKRNYIRINAISTEYFLDDLYQTVTAGLSGIVLPKANTKDDITVLDCLLSSLERKKGLVVGSLSIIPIIETALGLYNAFDIASASKRIDRLAFGIEDYVLDLNIGPMERRNGLLYAKSKLVTDSRAANINAPIDAIYPDFKDEQGLRMDTEKGKQLGFQGKLLIHPNQIPTVTSVFTPTAEEIAEARKIINSFEEAVDNGAGSIGVNGKMIDIPVVERAKRILAYGAQINGQD